MIALLLLFLVQALSGTTTPSSCTLRDFDGSYVSSGVGYDATRNYSPISFAQRITITNGAVTVLAVVHGPQDAALPGKYSLLSTKVRVVKRKKKVLFPPHHQGRRGQLQRSEKHNREPSKERL